MAKTTHFIQFYKQNKHIPRFPHTKNHFLPPKSTNRNEHMTRSPVTKKHSTLLITWTEYFLARLVTESSLAILCEIANFQIPFSLQKLPDTGSPTISFNFHGSINAGLTIASSEAMSLHSLQTQLARAKSRAPSFRKIIISVSLHVKDASDTWESIVLVVLLFLSGVLGEGRVEEA
jgi:hypothetical protein